MSLTAIDENGKKYDTTVMTVSEMKALRGKDLFCTCGCGTVKRIRAIQSVYYRANFFEIRKGTLECVGKPETPEHLAGKDYIQALLKETYAGTGCVIDIEHTFCLNDGITRRQADVMVLDKDGEWVEAHEIQWSVQGIDDYERRTEEYRAMGIEVCWWVTERKSENRSLQDFAYRTGVKIFVLRLEYVEVPPSELSRLHRERVA